MMLHRHFAHEPEQIEPSKQEIIRTKLVLPTVTSVNDITFDGKRSRSKAIVYGGTRNLYEDMIPAVKSAIANSCVDKIHLLIEDDEFPYPMPEMVSCINVADQRWFKHTGPNYKNPWSYMILIRTAFARIFPQYQRILSLDVDTIVDGDITSLFKLDLEDNYFAAVQEYTSKNRPYGDTYYNVGVMIQNLELLRSSGMSDKLMTAVNTEKFKYVEQDCINLNCAGRILDLPVKYNDSFCCGYRDTAAIIHYAGYSNWQKRTELPKYDRLIKYRNMSWDTAMDMHKACKERHRKAR